ncbi:RidA family protein [Pedobacter caeni]|uniref:Enamine deaminase RidA, house cleaning of reactive enamine intermediates, YjgF/YER057c/UK114 family n=1 Tax=Pedobacter caeni TaxID=288992 RepID=A0A1M5L1J2_9SPHI|nr:RidA family protein [Pedobacter caeni]SHG58609.1 Enamine deaminase RidA, house cleaning of reactive enamine intermediates, YjgF/YER057c/UK114 family [Pedobacter caeni]
MAIQAKSQEISNPKGLYDPRPHGYSHVTAVPVNSSLVFVAGQAGTNEKGELSADFRTQVRFTLKNIETALKSKGLTLRHIAKLTTLVVDYGPEKHKILIEESQKAWPDEKYPVNTLIPVSRLALDGMQIEIDATAVLLKD